MKFCKDCKYFQKQWGIRAELASCVHPKLLEYNMVSGATVGKFCDTQRRFDHLECGPEGRLWEAKQ